MSMISDLGKNLENLPNVLIDFEEILIGYENNIQVKGKTLEMALKEQASWYSFYNQNRLELNTIISYLESKLKRIKAKFYIQYNENYNPKLGERAIEKYIDSEQDVQHMQDLILECQNLLDKYDMILDAFNRRGFVLNNITACRVNEVHESTL